jgi:hypothetical protein
MFQIHELTHFGTPACDTAQLPSPALIGVAWTQTNDDPFFAEINPTAMGYRRAPRGFANRATQHEDRMKRLKAFPTLSMDGFGRAILRFGGGSRDSLGA